MAVEVEDNIAELGRLALKMSTGKNRKEFLKLVATEDPAMPIPEIEADRAIEAATKPLQEKISKLEADRQKDESMKNLEARRSAVPHIKGDELKKLEQFMVDKGIADYEIAEREMKRLDQVATPRPTGQFGRAQMPEADKDGLLYKDPAKFRNNKLHSMIDELKAGKTI